MTAAEPRIDLAVVGAQKAGTTTLYRLLIDSPDVNGHQTLEFPYFTTPPARRATVATEMKHRFVRPTQPGQLTAVKSSGLMYLPWAPARLAEHSPQVKTVAIVREPVSRAYSAYWYLRRVGAETLDTFEEALAQEPARLASGDERLLDFTYVDRGRYAFQIQRLDEQFGAENVLVVTLDALHRDPEATVNEVRRFAGLAPTTLSSDERTRENAAATSRSRLVARAIRPPEHIRRRLFWVPVAMRARMKALLLRANEQPFTPPPLARATADHLLAEFRESNAALAERIGVELHWDTQQCRVAP